MPLRTLAIAFLCLAVAGCGSGATGSGRHGSERASSAAASSASSAASAASAASASSARRAPALLAGWVDQPVTFVAGGVTIYGTYRHPARPSGGLPAVLLIAGSGPTDRNGNTPDIPGAVDTLLTVAGWLSADGVASLRYDKLGSGRTGLAHFRSDPAALGIEPYEQEAAAGLRFLAGQPGVDRRRLGIIGHSEGALFALLAAAHASGPAAPPVHVLGLLEPISRRYLDLISEQIRDRTTAALRARLLSAGEGAVIKRQLATAIAALRATGQVPANLSGGLGSLFNPSTATFLAEADRQDPARLAARLPPHFPVLVSCSDADIQVSCADVAHLLAGLRRARASTDLVRLHGVDHVLKLDPTRTSLDFGAPLPSSPQLRAALSAFVTRHLR